MPVCAVFDVTTGQKYPYSKKSSGITQNVECLIFLAALENLFCAVKDQNYDTSESSVTTITQTNAQVPGF